MAKVGKRKETNQIAWFNGPKKKQHRLFKVSKTTYDFDLCAFESLKKQFEKYSNSYFDAIRIPSNNFTKSKSYSMTIWSNEQENQHQRVKRIAFDYDCMLLSLNCEQLFNFDRNAMTYPIGKLCMSLWIEFCLLLTVIFTIHSIYRYIDA